MKNLLCAFPITSRPGYAELTHKSLHNGRLSVPHTGAGELNFGGKETLLESFFGSQQEQQPESQNPYFLSMTFPPTSVSTPGSKPASKAPAPSTSSTMSLSSRGVSKPAAGGRKRCVTDPVKPSSAAAFVPGPASSNGAVMRPSSHSGSIASDVSPLQLPAARLQVPANRLSMTVPLPTNEVSSKVAGERVPQYDRNADIEHLKLTKKVRPCLPPHVHLRLVTRLYSTTFTYSISFFCKLLNKRAGHHRASE